GRKAGRAAACRVKDANCGRSLGMAKTILDGIKAGKTDDQVVAAVKTAAPAAAAPVAAAPTGPIDFALDGAQIKGNPKAKVTMVEFADFQCPYCARALDTVQQLTAKYGDDLRFVYKQYPLTSIHPFAEPAARASIAAGKQGKFWQMYDTLFHNNRALDDASLKKYAQDLGLDMAKFDKDRTDASTTDALNKDVMEAQRSGVQGTPSFFINGIAVPSWDVE